MIARRLVYVAMAVMLLNSCIGESAESGDHITEGMKVPAFTLSGDDGAVFESPQDLLGRTTLLIFFATWCPQCEGELPIIEEVWEAVRKDKNLNVVAISRGGEDRYLQTETIISEYWSEHGYSMAWYLDEDRRVFDAFATSNIPRVYIIDATGKVVWYAVSPELDTAAYLELLDRYSK